VSTHDALDLTRTRLEWGAAGGEIQVNGLDRAIMNSHASKIEATETRDPNRLTTAAERIY